jgi:hypothetical protein
MWVSDFHEKQWNDNFEHLIGYKQEYGDCLVPRKYIDPSLGHWVRGQRRNFKNDTIREDRKRRLDELGFDWGTGRYQQKLSRDTSKNDFRWKNMYQKLVDFNQQNGHAMVPTYQKGLGHWVSKQRVRYRNGRMTDDRKELLDEIGVVWKISSPDANADRLQRRWDGMFHKLVEYREIHGNCNVPKTWDNDSSLGRWVQKQRVIRQSMDASRVERLDSVGFCWKPPRGWAARYGYTGTEHADEADSEIEEENDDVSGCSSHDERGGESCDRKRHRISNEDVQQGDDSINYWTGPKVKKVRNDSRLKSTTNSWCIIASLLTFHPFCLSVL